MAKIFNFYKLLLTELWNWFKKYVKNWRNNLKNLFLKNLREKFIAILLAFLTFGYVRYQDVEQRNLFVPLEIIKIDELTFANELPKNVSLFVSGNRSELNNLDVNKIVARIDLTDITDPGVYQRRPILETMPEGIQVIQINPQNLEIELSNLDRKIINIEPTLIGSPSRGYVVESVDNNPSRIWVFGPPDILQDITRITTETIDIGGLDADRLVSVNFSKNIHPALRFDRSRKIDVSINIESEYSVQSIATPVQVKVNVSSPLILISKPMISNVSFQILKTELDGFNFNEDLQFVIDATTISTPGVFRLPIKVIRNKRIRNVKYVPRSLNVELEEESKTFFPDE